jgi:hypothetical protein
MYYILYTHSLLSICANHNLFSLTKSWDPIINDGKGLALSAVTIREDPNDVVVFRKDLPFKSLKELPSGNAFRRLFQTNSVLH